MLYKRKVTRGGNLTFMGRRFQNDELAPFVGKFVWVCPDVVEFDILVFTAPNDEYICLATNKKLFAMMVSDAEQLRANDPKPLSPVSA